MPSPLSTQCFSPGPNMAVSCTQQPGQQGCLRWKFSESCFVPAQKIKLQGGRDLTNPCILKLPERQLQKAMVKITDHMLLPGPTMCQGPFQYFCEEGLDPPGVQTRKPTATSHRVRTEGKDRAVAGGAPLLSVTLISCRQDAKNPMPSPTLGSQKPPISLQFHSF